LYLGCEIKIHHDISDAYSIQTLDCDLIHHISIDKKPEKFKPMLRHLSDMTTEEWRSFFSLDETATIIDMRIGGNHISWDYRCIHPNPERNNYDGFSYSYVAIGKQPKIFSSEFIWLLSKGFDLFGLIPEGIAIDKTTLIPKEPNVQECDATKMP